MMALIERRKPELSGGLPGNLLCLSVYGFALSLLLGRGTYKPSLYLCAFAVAGILVRNRDRLRLQRSVQILLGLGLVFLLQGIAMADRPIPGGFHWALAWSALAATAVTLLPDRINARYRLDHGSVSAALLLIFVAAQAVAYSVKFNKAGLFSNIHYLALYSVITLPVLYFFTLRTQKALRWIFILALAGDFWLLMKTQSRPGFLALLAGALATVPFLPARHRLIALGATLLIPAALYFTGIFGFAARINDLATNFVREERLTIWRETLGMLSDNSVSEWWFGHGLGQYYWDYQAISSFHRIEDYSSPHNFFLDLLYSHGITGLALFMLAYGLFFGKLAAATLASHQPSRRLVGILLISITTADLVHGFLTIPFFSRHNLYPLSLILGAGFRYFRNNPRND
jgi:O-antigen ligase